MGAHKNKTRGGIELCSAPSTQTFGIKSTVLHKSRTRVEVCLLCVCGITLMICVILAALFAVELSKHNEHVSKPSETNNGGTSSTPPPNPTTGNVKPSVCNTAECLELAARFKRNMNESMDPCEDFFHFACDGWIRDNPIPPSQNEYITFIKKIQANNEKLRNMLEDATGKPDDPIMKAKRYYRSCMNEEEVERTTKQQMLELIESLGSWALDNKTWNGTVWNWKSALVKIQKTFLHSSPLFTIDVLTNPRHSTKHIVKVSYNNTPSYTAIFQ